MANNYTPSYNQYLTQSAGYALPSSVRTYSVFDPSSNSWRRMTNDGMSPMPQGNQADIQAALAQARQTQGTVYPAQGMGQGQPVEMHPGYMNPSAQAPAPVHASRRAVRQTTQPNITPATTQQSTESSMQITEVPENISLWGNQGKLQDGTPVVINLPKDPNFSTGIAVHQPLLNAPVNNPTTATQAALARHYGQKTTPNLPGFINTKPNRVVTFGEHLAKLGNGFFRWLGLNRPTDLDPYLSNHSDPRW